MREFTDQQGDRLLDDMNHVLDLPNVMEVGDKIVNMLPAKIDVWRTSLLYGIGTPPKAQPDAAHSQLIMRPQFMPGTDDEVRRQLAAGRKGVVPDPIKKRDPGPVLAKAMASIGKKQPPPREAIPELMTDDGELLEVVEDHEVPQVYDETRRQFEDE